jgi:predicted ATPase/transcriptional regulator with XRE-family HTH domain
MNLELFRKRLRQHCQPTGYTQKELARELGVHSTSLSHKLNGNGKTYLTHPEIKQIIKLLAQWGAISRRSEAYELLELVDLKPSFFSPAEWKTAPLDELDDDSNAYRPVAPSAAAKPVNSVANRPVQQKECIRPPETETPELPSDEQKTNWQQLPAQLNAFIGREKELAELGELLRRPAVRLVSLVGPGGVGKTRLSLQLAQTLVPEFDHGVCFVPLAHITETQLVLPTIAQTLGIKEGGLGESLLKALQARLSGKQLLLVLDNFEQIWEAAPDLVGLLENIPTLKMLVTSRLVLNVYGEHEYSLSPLKLPPVAQPSISLSNNPGNLAEAEPAESEAVRLFVERAKAVKFNFSLTETNLPVIAALCQRLDGLPLAIELAAAQCKLLSPQAILDQLEQTEPNGTAGLDFSVSNLQNQASRQQTLRATLDWSFRLLVAEEQILFRRLAVFRGDCSLAAVREICYPDSPLLPQSQVLEQLGTLVDKSMLRQVETEYSEPFFTLLQTIREYAQEKLSDAGELKLLSQNHFRYYLNLVKRAESGMYGKERAFWLARLEHEHPNLRAALAWGQTSGSYWDFLQLCAGLGYFWELHSHLQEGQSWLETALHTAPTDQVAETETLFNLYTQVVAWSGILALRQGDLRQAEEKLLTSRDRFRQTDNRSKLAWVLTYLGIVRRQQGNFAEAETFYEESCQLFRRLGNNHGLAGTLAGLASVAFQRADMEQAQELYRRSLNLFQQSEDWSSSGQVLNSLGEIARCQEDWSTAAALYRESLDILSKTGDKMGCAIVWHNLGHVERRCGQLGEALSAFKKSLQLNQELARPRGIANCLVGLAGVLSSRKENLEQAAGLLGAAEAIRDKTGTVLDSADAIEHQNIVTELSGALGESDFQKAWKNGRSLPAPAIQLAIRWDS